MKFLKNDLKGMSPYHATKYVDGVVLNANESPFNLPKKIIKQFKNEIDNLDFNRYPDMDNTILRQSISKAYNVSNECVTVGVGSDELIDCLYKGCVSKGDTAISFKPSFSMYKEYGRIHGANFVEVPLNDDFSANVDGMLEALKTYVPKLVFLCNPNNPTGYVMSHGDLVKIIEAAKNSLVVIDEAYVEFFGEGEINLVFAYPNVCILRTFSKYYSLASMRCGYAISNRDVIEMIDTVKSPYNLNTLTQTLAKICFENRDLFKENLNVIKEEKERVIEALMDMKIKIYPSGTNFIFMELTEIQAAALEINKVYIRNFSYNNKKYYRVTIGTKQENDIFLKVVRDGAR